MLQDLRNRANTALGHICDENAPHPHSNDYASHLIFFTHMVTRLEARSDKARRLVEERSRGLLGRAFSRVFSHLRNTFPALDFDAAIAPVPQAVRGDLPWWVEDNVDALVRAFTSEDDAVVVAADGGDVVMMGTPALVMVAAAPTTTSATRAARPKMTWRTRRATYPANSSSFYCFALYAKTRAWPLKIVRAFWEGGPSCE